MPVTVARSRSNTGLSLAAKIPEVDVSAMPHVALSLAVRNRLLPLLCRQTVRVFWEC